MNQTCHQLVIGVICPSIETRVTVSWAIAV